MNGRSPQRSGFTLIEMIIAIGLFAIVVTIAVNGFITSLRTQREVAALIAAQSNASEAIEQMAREMRTGYLFCIDPNNAATKAGAMNAACSCVVNSDNSWTCNNTLHFYNAASHEVTYSLASGALTRMDALTSSGGPITGDNVRVKYLTFTLWGNIEGDHWTPRVTVAAGIAPNSTDPIIANTVVNLETTVSARSIDCDISNPNNPPQC